jgi:PadR family transcriptional regulator, regulatory protein PadR
MSRRDYLGEFEHIVVLALMRLGDRAYGVSVRQEIATCIDRDVSVGAIYATLERMEAKGYVTSTMGGPTAKRGGRPKRFFRVTAKGMSALNCARQALLSMSKGLKLVGRYT